MRRGLATLLLAIPLGCAGIRGSPAIDAAFAPRPSGARSSTSGSMRAGAIPATTQQLAPT